MSQTTETAAPPSNVVTLTTPIVQGPVRYAELTFRTPNGGDLCAAGFPFKFVRTEEGDTARVFDAPAMTQLISRLAGIPLSAAKQLSVPDWTKCVAVMSDFFVDPNSPDQAT